MWPYPSYNRAASWDRYYSQSLSSGDQRHATITSGIAALLTVAVFFTVFLLTFACRLLNSRRRERRSLAAPPYSLDDQSMFVCCSAPPPLPSYEQALKMPAPSAKGQPSPPSIHAPFHVPNNGKETAVDGQTGSSSSSSANPSPPPFPRPRSPPPPFSPSARRSSQ